MVFFIGGDINVKIMIINVVQIQQLFIANFLEHLQQIIVDRGERNMFHNLHEIVQNLLTTLLFQEFGKRTYRARVTRFRCDTIVYSRTQYRFRSNLVS